MCLLHFLDNCTIFFFLGLIYGIMMIDTLDRFIGRDFNNVHTVNITELLFLCECCTSHTGLFVKFVKEVLECDRCKRLALTFYFYMLLRFDCLMKSV